ncbi:MAG: exodeoxyribonuclease VII small subunit [Candidatus Marinimicrobia bacterium]|nr:exodeoxyribonuclease VII small subunit [Candidatus Neomarinimicrobiota bacterium]|tara:strand:+ start:1392 stop:1622 length:231 start_codon:yes stop_codon:yes gene_type:complete
MEKNDKELSIELSLERLELIVSKMESGEVSLEKSLVLFEEGMNLIRECQGDLKKAEQRIEHLINDSGKLKGSEESS